MKIILTIPGIGDAPSSRLPMVHAGSQQAAHFAFCQADGKRSDSVICTCLPCLSTRRPWRCRKRKAYSLLSENDGFYKHDSESWRAVQRI